MDQERRLGIIGDHNRSLRSHIATEEALGHAATALSISVTVSWIPTPSLANGSVAATLKPFHALWCAPGSPYKSMEGALEGIRFAREQGWPVGDILN